ncbi:MAG: hypothetical protein HYZ00_06895, partial [Candidatus Hydrogenedentes bacterium]|nr:hypothetical protein [Candidatus Hydrogenedentota bacterium]
RTVTGGEGKDGLVLLVTIYISANGNPDLTALGLEETLPDGWQYEGLIGGETPSIAPQSGTTGRLEFCWFPLPAPELSFTYSVSVTGAGKSLDAINTLEGQGLYRVRGGGKGLRAPIKVRKGGTPADTALAAAAGALTSDPSDQSDLAAAQAREALLLAMAGGGTFPSGAAANDYDHDGLASGDEGEEDEDGDGIPNYLDPDSDGDAIFDSYEGAADIDGDKKPNFLDIDSDDDGTTDDIDGESDADGDGVPNFEDAGSALPVAPWAWAALAAALALCALRVMRRANV